MSKNPYFLSKTKKSSSYLSNCTSTQSCDKFQTPRQTDHLSTKKTKCKLPRYVIVTKINIFRSVWYENIRENISVRKKGPRILSIMSVHSSLKDVDICHSYLVSLLKTGLTCYYRLTKKRTFILKVSYKWRRGVCLTLLVFSSLLDIKKGTCFVHDYKEISIKKVNFYGWLNQGVEGGWGGGAKHLKVQCSHLLAI